MTVLKNQVFRSKLVPHWRLDVCKFF